MSNINAANSSQTPFQTLNQSTPAKFVKENAGLSAAAAVATSVIAKNVADHSELAATALKKGALPLVGAGVAVLGASMIHDAFAGGNDAPEDRLMKIGKATGGGALMLAGAEIAARPFGASPLKVLSKAVLNPATGAVLLAAPGIGAAVWGAQDIKENGLTVANAAAIGAGSTWATVQGTIGVMELAGASSKLTDLAFKGVNLVGGASLGLGAAALGKEAYTQVKEGNWDKVALYGGGAVAAGVTSAHMLGNATGVSALSNLAGKALKNPLLAGSIAVVGLTGVAYVAYSSKKTEEQ